MAITVMYDAGAHISVNSLNQNLNHVGKALEKISTGQKFNDANGNASSYAISGKMLEQIRSLYQDDQNVQNGSSMIRTAERGINQIVENLRTMKEKALDAANDSNTDEDRRTIQKEIDQRREVINDIAVGTKYNGRTLLNGTFDKVFRLQTASESSIDEDPRPKVDVMFVVDTTGSMSSYIKKVASNLKIFSDSLTTKGLNWKFGLVRYDDINPTGSTKDIGVKKVSFSDGDFTNDDLEFVNALNNLVTTLGSGGDIPESGYEGVMEAISAPFRDNAVKRIIVLSDASVHKAGGKGSYTSDGVIAALKAKNIKLSAITALDNSSANADWSALTNATEGNLYNISDDYGVKLAAEAADLKEEVDSSSESSLIGFPIWIQHGTQAGQRVHFFIHDMRARSLGIDKAEVTTIEHANNAISAINAAIETALDEATTMGAYLQRLESSFANVVTMRENIQGAESTIRDADMAKEITEYTKYNILSQSSQAMLAQSNQNGSFVLGMLQ